MSIDMDGRLREPRVTSSNDDGSFSGRSSKHCVGEASPDWDMCFAHRKNDLLDSISALRLKLNVT